MLKSLTSTLLIATTTTIQSSDIDCEFSYCSRALSTTDCQEIVSSCTAEGGVPACRPGEFKYECNNLPRVESCTTDQAATFQCDGYTFSTSLNCGKTDGDCDATTQYTRAPTSAGNGGPVTQIDCSYEACSLPLTLEDCSSLGAKCSAYGGSIFCTPGDDEFDCKNIDYAGAGICSDASAKAQCDSYVYAGYTCTDRDGDCDNFNPATFAPTPATDLTVQRFDCTYEDCTSFLTTEDCAAIATQCSAVGGISFCVPGTNEFECNSITWTGSGGCSDTAVTAQCLQYSFPGMTCTDQEGDCVSMSSSDNDDDQVLTDSQRVLVAFAIPLLIVACGCFAWSFMSKRSAAKAKNPPLVPKKEAELSSEKF